MRPGGDSGVDKSEYPHETGKEVLSRQIISTLHRVGEVGVGDTVPYRVPRVPCYVP